MHYFLAFSSKTFLRGASDGAGSSREETIFVQLFSFCRRRRQSVCETTLILGWTWRKSTLFLHRQEKKLRWWQKQGVVCFQRSDVGMINYVSGYISRQLIKSTYCDSCKTMFSESQEHLPLDTDEAMASSDVIAEGKSFIDAISRGGLVKPSNLLFVTCMYATDLIRYIRKNPSKLSYLFESGDSRAVFIEAFLCKLKESNDTSPIIKARKKG